MSLQKRRVDRGWSQEDLAQLSGLSVRTIQRLETGKRASLESLKCLAAVFETSVSELVEEQTMTNTQPPPPPPASTYFTEQAERDAIAYVQNLKGFHLNWISFLIIVPMLFLLNLWLSPEVWWIVIVILSWGGAILLHAVLLFSMFSLFSGKWEQTEFQKRMQQR